MQQNSLYRTVCFPKVEGILGFSVLSVVLADLLGNTWFVIGGFQSVLFAAYFKICFFVIVLFWAIIDWLSLLSRFSGLSYSCHLPISFHKKSTHHHDFLQLESFSAKMGEHVTLWFVLTSPSPKCLAEQVNPKSFQRLQYVWHNTTNFALTLRKQN